MEKTEINSKQFIWSFLGNYIINSILFGIVATIVTSIVNLIGGIIAVILASIISAFLSYQVAQFSIKNTLKKKYVNPNYVENVKKNITILFVIILILTLAIDIIPNYYYSTKFSFMEFKIFDIPNIISNIISYAVIIIFCRTAAEKEILGETCDSKLKFIFLIPVIIRLVFALI